jgi:hypothetical protein
MPIDLYQSDTVNQVSSDLRQAEAQAKLDTERLDTPTKVGHGARVVRDDSEVGHDIRVMTLMTQDGSQGHSDKRSTRSFRGGNNGLDDSHLIRTWVKKCALHDLPVLDDVAIDSFSSIVSLMNHVVQR